MDLKTEAPTLLSIESGLATLTCQNVRDAGDTLEQALRDIVAVCK